MPPGQRDPDPSPVAAALDRAVGPAVGPLVAPPPDGPHGPVSGPSADDPVLRVHRPGQEVPPRPTPVNAGGPDPAGGAGAGATPVRSLPDPDEVVSGLKATAGGDLVQLLGPEGEYTPNADYPLDVDAELLRGLYRDMVLVRRFDREGNALQRQGQLGLWVPLLGQEGAQIGAGRALQPQDMVFPSYREHGVAWCRDIDPAAIASIFRGVDFGAWDPVATRFHPYTIVIGNQAINAAGYAMGQRLDGRVGSGPESGAPDEATVVFFGDGATSQGDVHEAMVFAAAFDAPLVLFCQNNQWAISTPTATVARVPLADRAAGYGFPGIRVDGNDVLACLAVTRWALDECRSGNGPVFVEAFTFRMDAHTTSDDPSRYRAADEAQAWKLLDPIERVRVHLVRHLGVGEDFFAEVAAAADDLAARFRAAVADLEPPPVDRMFAHVYAGENAAVSRARAEFLGSGGIE